MPCYHPFKAYLLKGLNKITGKKRIQFKPSIHTTETLKLPCGQCWGCRLERSRIWSIRCMHEAQLHEHNQYVTLTYNQENLPEDDSLKKKDLTDFWKRLRKKFKIRYYACGEYGDEKERPHYHAIIFGLKLDDLTYYRTTRDGFKLYNSKVIDEIWTHGYCTIGAVTFESCAYVARYIMKKQLGKGAEDHYLKIDKSTGEILSDRTPEYTVMSNRPGIGKKWFDKFKSDIYQAGTDGKVIIRGGTLCQPPRYYEDKYELESECNKLQIIEIKKERKKQAQARELDNTPARLKVKEQIKIAQAKSLKRSLKDH